ncbi:MAG: HdeD family acid-resistance protein [Marinibacterium sp.]
MKAWVIWLILGILSMIFGVFVLSNTVVASLAVTTVTGILFLISGGFQIVAGFTAEGAASKIFAIALGVLMVFLGISFVANPLEGTISLALLVVILLMASGVVRMVFAWRMRTTPFFWPMLLSGALSILLAGYIIANFATASVQILGILLGIELLFNGAGLMVLAFFLRTIGKKLRK